MLLIFRGHCHSPFSFQFSFWDSCGGSGEVIPYSTDFQFSFWDSVCLLESTTDLQGGLSFNSLFEIQRFESLVALMCAHNFQFSFWDSRSGSRVPGIVGLRLSFNSLFEIQDTCWRGNTRRKVHTFNSLFEILVWKIRCQRVEAQLLSILFLRFKGDLTRQPEKRLPLSILFLRFVGKDFPRKERAYFNLSILFLRFGDRAVHFFLKSRLPF